MGKKSARPRSMVTQSCIFCGKQLSTYSSLIEHINGHTGERSCRCVPCDLWFATATVLCQHRRIVHEGKKLTCPFCNKQFNFSSNLWDHKRRAHFKQFQQLKRKREIQRNGGGSRILFKKTTKSSRVLKNKTVKYANILENRSEEENILEESQEVEKWAEEEEISEESEEEPLYPHQISNHEEYFNAIDKQRSAALAAIFKAFPLVKLKEDKFQVHSFAPFKESVKKITEVTATIAKNVVEVNNNKVSVKKPPFKIVPTSTSKECTICGKSSTTRSNLFKHLRNVHGVQQPARKCSMKRKRKEEEGVTENKSFPLKSSGNQVKHKCNKCSSLFSHSYMLRKHMTTRHPGCSGKITPGQRRIPVTSRRTGQEESFNERRRGSERGLFKCAKCDGKYSWRFDLIKHIRRKHPELDISSLEIDNMATPNVSRKPFEKKVKQEVVNKKQNVITPGVTIRRNYKSDVSIKVAAKKSKIVFKCYKCSATLPRVAALKRHMTLIHENCPTKILIVNQDLSSTSTNAKNTTTMTVAFKCPECSVTFKWKKNLVRHIRSTHDSPGNCGAGEVLEEPPGIELNPTENSDQANRDLGNVKTSLLSLEPVVNKRRVLRRAPNETGSDVKAMAADSNWSKEDFKVTADVPTVSMTTTGDPCTSADDFPTVASPDVSTSGGSGRFKCDKCGQSFSNSRNLVRHKNRNGCLHVKRLALNKLDALLKFICEICDKEFIGNSKMGSRSLLECHLATVHRFHHINGREYLKLSRPPPIYFCLFCGSKEATKDAMVKHFRGNHRELLGVPKNSSNVTGSSDKPIMTSDPVPNSRRSRVRCQCLKCGRWFMEKSSLDRHSKRKSCHYVQREAFIKLDATLDFICQICNRNFTHKGKRHMLECHLASVHRFHHENAREYQHLKTGIYFCPLCGSKEASRNGMTAHLRRKHMEELGVRKKTPKSTGSAVHISTMNGICEASYSSDNNEKKTGVAAGTMEADLNRFDDLQEPLKISENQVHATFSDVNNLPDSLAINKCPYIGPVIPGNSLSVGQCDKCGRWFREKSSLDRHTRRQSCYHVQREALMKLDATLDFTCQICKKEFNRGNANRRALERHLATVHRFHHENAREYLKLCKAPEVYFCLFCGSKETSSDEMIAHLRSAHLDVVGVPKKTDNAESSVAESQGGRQMNTLY